VFARRHLLAEAERDGPASSILARGFRSSIRFEDCVESQAFPCARTVAAGRDRPWDATSRLQWRHRVGFSPTSRDRRAKPAMRFRRLDVNCSGEYNIVEKIARNGAADEAAA
jgi:hypothetical protein